MPARPDIAILKDGLFFFFFFFFFFFLNRPINDPSHLDLNCLYRYWFWFARLKGLNRCAGMWRRGEERRGIKPAFMDIQMWPLILNSDTGPAIYNCSIYVWCSLATVNLHTEESSQKHANIMLTP